MTSGAYAEPSKLTVADFLEKRIDPTKSNIGITLDLYSHVLPGMQEDAAAKVDLAIRSAIEKARKV